ncbi:Fic family protein [Tunturiibacter gelidiferens]
MIKINTGAWRDDGNGPMQVVPGPVGRERVHFQAPAAAKLDGEMNAFLDWFNTDASNDPVLKAGIAHLWFVTIHPFDDGNGRIARAITDMSLARSEDSSQRFYSMSAQIRQEREEYYEILEATQKGTLDITRWLAWFLDCLGSAIEGAHTTLAAVLAKAHFWERIAGTAINERQRMILNRLLDGFEGNLTTSKYAKLAKSSNDTALRDILFLVENGILARNAEGGRSTSYDLVRNHSQKTDKDYYTSDKQLHLDRVAVTGAAPFGSTSRNHHHHHDHLYRRHRRHCRCYHDHHHRYNRLRTPAPWHDSVSSGWAQPA